VETFKGRREVYADGIASPLQRAAEQAELTATATGTRLVISERGRIRRVTLPLKMRRLKMRMMPGRRMDLAKCSGAYSSLNRVKLQAGGRHSMVAERNIKYGSE
jgi:hypothetical protein